MARARRDRKLERRLARLEAKVDALILLAGQSQGPGPDWVAAVAREVVGEMFDVQERRR